MLLKTSNIKRLLSLLLTFAFILIAPPQKTVALSDEEKQEIISEKEQLQAEIEENQKLIEELEKKAAEYDDDLAILQEKIDIYQKQIDLHNQEIALIDEDISKIELQIESINAEIQALAEQIIALQDEIEIKEQERQKIYDILAERLRASYMSGPGSSLEYILTADDFDFESYLDRVELIQRIAEQDQQNIDDLEKAILEYNEAIAELQGVQDRHADKITELNEAKDEHEKAKQEQLDARDEVEAIQSEFNAELDEIKAIVNSYNAESQALQDAIDKREETMDELDKQLADKNTHYGSGVVDGDMVWPLPFEDVYISSSFKLRTLNGVTRWHNGIDTCRWSGTQGADVIAVKDGVIESAGWNGGYGNLIVVNHGNGVLSYYAHLSGYNCSVGQSVSQGDVIGYAGNTGYSFGAHLHFGLMINGNWVDPVLYLTRYTPNGTYIQHTDADGH